jgi:hypothetical protein
VRCGGICRAALALRYPEYVVVFCGGFLWLYGICALAVSANATLAMQIKRVRLMIFPQCLTSLIKHRLFAEVALRVKLSVER